MGVRNGLVCTIIILYAWQKKFLTPAIPSPSPPKEKKKKKVGNKFKTVLFTLNYSAKNAHYLGTGIKSHSL